MKLDFDEGEAGFFEARLLHRFIQHARIGVQDEEMLDLLEFMDESANTHMRLAEFAVLFDKHGSGDETWPNFSVLKHLWRQTIGSSQVEASLAEQRSAALARAERAEQSAFEALAEMAKIERERDIARIEVEKLRKELAALQSPPP